MADHYAPTVIQQTIPEADMTPLQLLLLSQIFDVEREGEGCYFFSEQGPADMILVERASLETALTESQVSAARLPISGRLASAACPDR